MLVISDYIVITARVWFELTSYTVNEDAGTVTLTIKTNVPGGPSDGDVEFYTEDDTTSG